jgi:hypothetical protein
VILRRPTAPAAPRDHQRFEKRPFLIRHQTANQDRLPKSSLESRLPIHGNPLCQQSLSHSLSHTLNHVTYPSSSTPLPALPDEEAIIELTTVPGIGRWTAELAVPMQCLSGPLTPCKAETGDLRHHAARCLPAPRPVLKFAW